MRSTDAIQTVLPHTSAGCRALFVTKAGNGMQAYISGCRGAFAAADCTLDPGLRPSMARKLAHIQTLLLRGNAGSSRSRTKSSSISKYSVRCVGHDCFAVYDCPRHHALLRRVLCAVLWCRQLAPALVLRTQPLATAAHGDRAPTLDMPLVGTLSCGIAAWYRLCRPAVTLLSLWRVHMGRCA